jgi:hypothetical protein
MDKLVVFSESKNSKIGNKDEVFEYGYNGSFYFEKNLRFEDHNNSGSR